MFNLFKQNKVLCIFAGLIILLAVVAVTLTTSNSSNPDSADEPEYTDFTHEKENLAKKLSQLVADNPNKDYESTSFQTRYSLTPNDYCFEAASNQEPEPALAAFSTILSVLSEEALPPSTLPKLTSNVISTETFASLADYYLLSFEEIPAMNSNILNYYLDNDYIVLIDAVGEEPYSSDGNYLVVLAAYPNTESYLVFSPTNENYRNTIVTRLEVLSSIKSDFKFYLFSKQSLGDES